MSSEQGREHNSEGVGFKGSLDESSLDASA